MPPHNRKALVRPHVVTGGRAHPTRNIFDLVTLVIAAPGDPAAQLTPEQRRIVRLCQGGALSVAEVAGHLSLPVSVVKVLLSDLVDSGHITTRAAGPSGGMDGLDRERILREVLDGLRARL
ncbi:MULTISPECIES: DUF742 domain-containing protein [Thermomonospora]|uniref:DNA-binding NarL/FixJ family response regulator n=1 Tax=Thermomonospora cellulosilytica TaxID=1411118 RepID=A0A7W3N3I0_9ACTN|nr:MULTISPECIES: DUF742 domain-containing protein [Thermomonospora]MBA9006891.1 DNA-binding NarL/FixJ family response regulator [Thermomonospora cellulosilytica]